MNLRCVPLLSCLLLVTCAGVSITGSPVRSQRDATDKSSQGETNCGNLYINGTETSNSSEQGSSLEEADRGSLYINTTEANSSEQGSSLEEANRGILYINGTEANSSEQGSSLEEADPGNVYINGTEANSSEQGSSLEEANRGILYIKRTEANNSSRHDQGNSLEEADRGSLYINKSETSNSNSSSSEQGSSQATTDTIIKGPLRNVNNPVNTKSDANPDESIDGISEDIDEVNTHNEHSAEDLDEVKTHNEHSAEDIDEVKTHNEHSTEDIDEVKKHNEHSAEHLDEVKTHNEHSTQDIDEVKTHNEHSTQDIGELNIPTKIPNSKGFGDLSVESLTSNKGGQSSTRNSLTSSKTDPRHNALMNREIDTVDSSGGKVDSEEDSDTDLPVPVGKERKHHRKKRLNPSASTPSAQLIILVVGAVLACVIITGFIRWRVRRRLNAKKFKQMSDDFSSKRGKKDFPKKSLMDTIYECDCENGANSSLTRDLGNITYSEVSQDDDESILDDDSEASSHRFDAPPSVTDNSCCDICSYEQLLPLKYSKTERDSPRTHHKHHGHKSRSSRHHRRRSHDKKYSNDVETMDIDSNIPRIHITKSPSFSLEENDDTDGQKSNSQTDPSVLLSSPHLLSPHPPRNVFGALVDTWRSLSFNREWVGRMWQEKHGVRRISDVLRGLTTISEPDVEISMQDKHPAEVAAANSVTVSTLSEEADVPTPAQSETISDNIICANSNDETCENSLTVRPLNEEQPSELSIGPNLSNENSASNVESDWSLPRRDCHVDSNPSSGLAEAEPSQMSRASALSRFMSLGDNLDEPPGYDSLLNSGRYSMNSLTTRGGVEHSRHHRRHRRKHRERSTRHVYSRVHETDQGNSDPEEGALSFAPLEHEPLPIPHRTNDQPPVPSLDPIPSDSDSMAATSCQTTASQGQVKVHTHYPNSPTSPSAIMGQFSCQQEGIVIEQLSDGAQIIYLPPPTLPSYHNDTPPPYHQ